MEQILKILIKPDTGKIFGIVAIAIAVLVWPPESEKVTGVVGLAVTALATMTGRCGKNA